MVMGATASTSTVIVATGTTHGQAPAAVVPVTKRIVGLDPRTGGGRWSMSVGEDGQGVPVSIYGEIAVVTQADATIVGLDPVTGRPRWSIAAPKGCSESPLSGVAPTATLLPDTRQPTVSYRCSGLHRFAQLDPSSGATIWSWSLPSGRVVDGHAPAGGDAGMLGVLVSGGDPIATERPPSGQRPAGYDTESLIDISMSTGAPQWKVDGVTPTAGVYAGSGHLCTVSGFGFGFGFGTTCYDAATGTQSWQRTPPAVPTYVHSPEMPRRCVGGEILLVRGYACASDQ